MAKRGNFTTVSRKEALHGETGNMPARAAFEQHELAGKAPHQSASSNSPAGTRSHRKIKRVTAQFPPTAADRREALLAFQPKRLTHTAYQPFREELVALVARISFVSTSVDQALLSSGVAYLGWILSTGSPESLVGSLSERRFSDFADYLEATDTPPSTVSTTVARLRLLRRGHHMPPRRARKDVSPPYTSADARRFWTALDRIPQARVFEARVLWALTFGVGLSAEEVQAATADWIVAQNGRTYVRVHYATGEFRMVPVIDPVAARVLTTAAAKAEQALADNLAERVRRSSKPVSAESWLLSPHMLDRRNAVTSVKVALRRVDGHWGDFSVHRARSCWLVNLLESAMPFSMVCQIAGLGPKTKTPTDLLAFMPEHRLDDIATASKKLRGVRMGATSASPLENGEA